MEQEKIVYQNNGFIITEHPRKREYYDEIINNMDRIYRIRIEDTNQPTIDDCAMLVYYLLYNKIKENKFQEYRIKILEAIHKAKFDRKKRNYEVR